MLWGDGVDHRDGATRAVRELEQRSGNSFTASSRASAMLFGIDATRATGRPGPSCPLMTPDG